MEGTVYTITPRLIMPGGVVDMPQGLTRRFWMTVRTPADARPGVYKGTITIRAEKGRNGRESRSRFASARETLDPVDIPAGPFGYTIGIPWFGEDPAAATLQPANGEKEPAKNARLWLHGLQRAAVDRVPRVRSRASRSSISRRPTRQ